MKQIKLAFAACVFAALLLAPTQASAQGSESVTLGVKAGLNIANVTENSDDFSFDSNVGLVFGAFVRRPLLDAKFAVQIEALFAQHGASFEDASLNINYLQFPILGVFSFAGDTASPFILAGVAPALSLGAKTKFGDETEDADDVAGADFSFVMGAGVDVQSWSIEARYLFGIKDIDQSDTNSKNRAFTVLVGYRFQ